VILFLLDYIEVMKLMMIAVSDGGDSSLYRTRFETVLGLTAGHIGFE